MNRSILQTGYQRLRTLFIRYISSSQNDVLSKDFKLSSICFTELAPIMTEATFSSFSNHANDISAKVCPRRAAISFKSLILRRTSSVRASFLR